jgi:hypothetical protein
MINRSQKKQIKKRIKELKRNAALCRKYKSSVDSKIGELIAHYKRGNMGKQEFLQELHQKRDGKSALHWSKYYDDLETEYHRQIVQHKKYIEVPTQTLIAVMFAVLLVGVFVSLKVPSLTGMAVGGVQTVEEEYFNHYPQNGIIPSLRWEKERPLIIDLSAYFFDEDGDQLTYFVSTAPEHLSIRIEGNLAIITPPAGYTGEDSVSFEAFDGEFSAYSNLVKLSVLG